MSRDDKPLRDHLHALLEGGHAHAGLDAAVKDLPPALRGEKPAGSPHSPWQLVEHLRIAQWDILEFSRDAKHVSPTFPDGYWPRSAAPPDDAAWEKSVASLQSDLAAMQKLVAEADLYTPFPWGDGQTVLREALVLADHNAYHVGQLILVRQQLGAWKG